MLTEVRRVGARLHHVMDDLHPRGQNSPDIFYLFIYLFLNPIYIPRESGNKLRTPEATTGEM